MVDAKVYINAPGFFVLYVNGKRVGKEVLSSPVSVWEKTLWVNRYLIKKYLKDGENELLVLCGNGYYNESVQSVWNIDKEKNRDLSKFALACFINGEKVVESDNTWKYTYNSPITFSELRMGEYTDLRKNLSDSDVVWKNAIIDSRPPHGKLKIFDCPPVRECERLKPKEIRMRNDGAFVVDFGKNISGYIELRALIGCGKEVSITYCEVLDGNL